VPTSTKAISRTFERHLQEKVEGDSRGVRPKRGVIRTPKRRKFFPKVELTSWVCAKETWEGERGKKGKKRPVLRKVHWKTRLGVKGSVKKGIEHTPVGERKRHQSLTSERCKTEANGEEKDRDVGKKETGGSIMK